MMGKHFAGSDESPGTFELYQGRKYKVYRNGSLSLLWRTEVKIVISRQVSKETCTGRCRGTVAYKGTVEDTVFQLYGRS